MSTPTLLLPHPTVDQLIHLPSLLASGSAPASCASSFSVSFSVSLPDFSCLSECAIRLSQLFSSSRPNYTFQHCSSSVTLLPLAHIFGRLFLPAVIALRVWVEGRLRFHFLTRYPSRHPPSLCRLFSLALCRELPSSTPLRKSI